MISDLYAKTCCYAVRSHARCYSIKPRHEHVHVVSTKQMRLVVIAVVLFLRQQSSVPAASKVLLQTTVSLRVGILWR